MLALFFAPTSDFAPTRIYRDEAVQMRPQNRASEPISALIGLVVVGTLRLIAFSQGISRGPSRQRSFTHHDRRGDLIAPGNRARTLPRFLSGVSLSADHCGPICILAGLIRLRHQNLSSHRLGLAGHIWPGAECVWTDGDSHSIHGTIMPCITRPC